MTTGRINQVAFPRSMRPPRSMPEHPGKGRSSRWKHSEGSGQPPRTEVPVAISLSASESTSNPRGPRLAPQVQVWNPRATTLSTAHPERARGETCTAT
ncbi:hypothetical protein LINGRAHAP2_LOCUS38507 [Linum grandiflorum]